MSDHGGMRHMYGGPPPPGSMRGMLEELVPKHPVDPPPSEAVSEIEVIAALEALDDAARARVLRYALSRWEVKP